MKVTPPVSYGFTVALAGPADVGEVYEVDDETGAQLVAQGWSEPAAKKAEAKSEANPAPDPQADTKEENA